MHVILWRFRVKGGCEAEFEQAYGPDGEWVQVFRRGAGYLGTELLRDESQRRTYITIDRWMSQAAHAAFTERWGDDYRALDRRLEALTERETPLGSFTSLPATTSG